MIFPSIILTVAKDSKGNFCVEVCDVFGNSCSIACKSLEEGLEEGKKRLGLPEKEYHLK